MAVNRLGAPASLVTAVVMLAALTLGHVDLGTGGLIVIATRVASALLSPAVAAAGWLILPTEQRATMAWLSEQAIRADRVGEP